jgi:hypothetical protein
MRKPAAERSQSIYAMTAACTCTQLPDWHAPQCSSFERSRFAPLAVLQAVQHYGEGLKAVINEKFGDGIMSGGNKKAWQWQHEGSGQAGRSCVERLGHLWAVL